MGAGPAGPRAGLWPHPQASQPSSTAPGPGPALGCKAGGARKASPGPAFRMGTGRDKAGDHPENSQVARRKTGGQSKPRKPGPAAQGETRLETARRRRPPCAPSTVGTWVPGHPAPRASPEDGSSTAHRLLGGPELVGRHVAWGPALGRVEMPCAPAEASLQTSAVLSALGAAPLPSLPTELPVLPSAQVSMEFPRPALPLHPLSHRFLLLLHQS